MSHDSPGPPLGRHSKLCLDRACPWAREALEEILLSPEVPRNRRFRHARARLREDNPEPGFSLQRELVESDHAIDWVVSSRSIA
jgi:hypothetical protein